MTKQAEDPMLPALAGSFAVQDGDFGYPVAPPQEAMQIPFLRIDQGSGDWSKQAGTWNYAGQTLGNAVRLIFVARFDYAILFEASYDEAVRSGGSNRIACASWDNHHARGRGVQSDRGPIEDRLCGSCRSRASFICKPKGKHLLLVKPQDVLLPAIFDASGKAYKPTMQAFADAGKAAMISVGPDGKQRHPIFLWALTAKLEKNKGMQGYAPSFSAPTLVADDEKPQIATAFGQGVLAQMWKGERDRIHQLAMEIGKDPEQEEVKPAEQKEDYGDIPF